jgi:hypothetical protein
MRIGGFYIYSRLATERVHFHRLRVNRFPARLTALLLLGACSTETSIAARDAATPEATRVALSEALLRAPKKVTIPTYDGSGQNVHPDVVFFANQWNGFKCWLSFTPYKGSNVALENPSIVASNDCENWQVPPGGVNPLVDIAQRNSVVYNSDSDHAYDFSRNASVMIFRSVAKDTNFVNIMETRDGITWTQPLVALSRASHEAVSPSIIIEPDRRARIWFVNTGKGGCSTGASTVEMVSAKPRRTESFIEADWSFPIQTNLQQPGYVIWHIDVIQLPDGSFMAVYAAFPQAYGSSCSNNDLFLAWSKDGLDWTTSNVPIRWRTMKELPLRSLYRATMLYTSGTNSLRIWFSAMDQNKNWWTYDSSYDYAKLMDALRGAAPGAAQVLVGQMSASRFEKAFPISP